MKKEGDKGSREGIYSGERFTYDKETDTYLCPGGEKLKPKSIHRDRESIDYARSKRECKGYRLRKECTRNKNGRTIKRHLRQDELDHMRALAGSKESKEDIKTKQHLMERLFARAKRYGFDRARWRGVWRA